MNWIDRYGYHIWDAYKPRSKYARARKAAAIAKRRKNRLRK